MKWIVFDLETSGLSPQTDDILEIGAVVWEDGQLGERFHSLVKPDSPVPGEIYALTGISPEELRTAPKLEDILPKFLAFLAGQRVAGYNVQFDIAFLAEACDRLGYDLPILRDALDAHSLARILLPRARDFRLMNIAAHFGIAVPTVHRADADADTTARVLSKLCEQAEALPYAVLQQLEHAAGLYSPATAAWFSDRAATRLQVHGAALPEGTDSIHQLVFSVFGSADGDSADQHTVGSDEFESLTQTDANSSDGLPDHGVDLRDWSARLLGQGSPLSSVMPGFQVRPGQQQMVEAVAQALAGDEHLIAEAGTGTGKSLAYLIPAALYAVRHQTRVVVSTHTIALQDQISSRDFPMLRQIVGFPLALAVFKGRTHYVCMRKLWQETRTMGFGTPREEIEAYMALLCWLVETHEGNREELSLQGKLVDVWPRVQSETETCINKRCPFFKPCYYFRARAQAFEADVVVTNHSLVFSDLKADHRVLPKYDKLILDEAHHLEEEATKHLGEEVHLAQCIALLGRLSRDGGQHGVLAELAQRLSGADQPAAAALPAVEQLHDLIRALRPLVEQTFHALARLMPPGQSEFRLTAAVEKDPAWNDYLRLSDEILQIVGSCERLQSALTTAAELETDDELTGRLLDAHGFLQELASHMYTLSSAGDLSDEWVVWIERSHNEGRTQWSLHRAPIDVGRILEESLFSKKGSVILTSATLSVEGRFDYLKQRLGMVSAGQDGRLSELSVPSPFNFRTQALLCVPNDVPELAKLEPEEAAVWLADSLYQLARISQGRLLALFTSHALLRATAKAVREPLLSIGLETFAQGIDGNRTRILEAFRNQPKSVLFGAQSFWEGIDLPGDQLTTLVIVRLPFTPPTHPVTEARHQRLEAEGRSAFWNASLPEAVVRFRQGFGRLIRTVNDRGVVVVYDKRIVTARYGSAFVRALPGVRPFVASESAVVERVRAFLQNRTNLTVN